MFLAAMAFGSVPRHPGPGFALQEYMLSGSAAESMYFWRLAIISLTCTPHVIRSTIRIVRAEDAAVRSVETGIVLSLYGCALHQRQGKQGPVSLTLPGLLAAKSLRSPGS